MTMRRKSLGRRNCDCTRYRRTLTIAFDTGETFELSAEYLRVRSPSAEVQGHSPDERKTVAGKQNVAILEFIRSQLRGAGRVRRPALYRIFSWSTCTSSGATATPIGRTISTSWPARPDALTVFSLRSMSGR